ncbi:lipopolysaccharide biosynthesis protein [Loigolactobacillus coryniformis]|uniref:lipopolysaccharide biosynthesis protein n=1 Tax=Loigolactobacillus coryniformis TaxID=1610 RepID=UPI003F25A433
MKHDSRIINSIRNSSVALLAQVVILLAQFSIQTVFVKTLGSEYLGANGLFSNILSFLSFAELGIGTAITYSLYKPISENNETDISAIMALFGKAYRLIGLFILIIGLIFSFAVPSLVDKNSSIPNIQLMFILYLGNSVISYFFTYKRTLIIANQQSYIDALNRVVFTAIQTILQVSFLLVTKQYVAFLLIQIIFTFISNLSISIKANKLFPYLKNKSVSKVNKEVKDSIKRNIAGAVVSKLGTIVAYSTDNILISKFLGLAVVGIYSNYMLILTSIQRITDQIFNALIASIANFSNTNTNKREEELFYNYMYLVAGIDYVLSTSIYFVVQPFIRIWAGESYLISNITVLLLFINWSINMMRNSITSFMSVHGLYWENRWKSLMESSVNLVVGLVLITTTNLGINSVIIGTLTANILINMWWEPIILISNGVRTTYLKYFSKYFKYVAINLSSLIIIYRLQNIISKNISNFFIFIGVGVAIFVTVTIVFIVLTFRTSELKFYKKVISERFIKH